MSFLGWLFGDKSGSRPAAVLEAVPRHVAVIMDGNGRWAKERGLPRTAGHRVGMDRVEEVVRACRIHGVKYLTLFAFSTENWRRAADEVGFLMRLFIQGLTNNLDKLNREGARLQIIGRRDRLPQEVLASIIAAEELTAANDAITLTLAIDYGARDEILNAVRTIARLARSGELDADTLDEQGFANYLYTVGIPDPDLLIRPSGEFRVSNFLLWQAAYAEFWFTPTLWPDFGREQLLEGLRAYAGRERRFGGAK